MDRPHTLNHTDSHGPKGVQEVNKAGSHRGLSLRLLEMLEYFLYKEIKYNIISDSLLNRSHVDRDCHGPYGWTSGYGEGATRAS
jgi:hypothetical protein